MNTGTLTVAFGPCEPSMMSVVGGLFGGGIVRVNVIAEPAAAVGGNAVTLLGRLELTKKLVAGLMVWVVPCWVIVPPPVATMFVFAPQARLGIVVGVTTIAFGVVAVLGGCVPTLLFNVAVAVCPAESDTAIVKGLTQPPSVVSVNPPPDAGMNDCAKRTNCGAGFDTV